MNRECFPGGVYPLVGDVESQAGHQNVTVVGIQSVKVLKTTLVDGDVLRYDSSLNMWVPYIGVDLYPYHDEPLTDGNGNFIFAATLTDPPGLGGDIIVVIGVPDN